MAANYNSSNGRPQQAQQSSGLPSASTFSFKAPFPVSPASAVNPTALKHRRVSLASPSSPRLVQPWMFRDEMGLQPQTPEQPQQGQEKAAQAASSRPEKKGKMRKIDTTQNSDESSAPAPEKKPRKKWSSEETQMLVRGCQLHGVGNWKTILQDPDLNFHDRSAVDLKDRFRTYFPDAYKKHYPNARTHLSSKIRSTFADGTSLFEKTRSKRRRPFTEAEDRALKAGYEKHGTTWATIVKDPIFQEQNRRSTDLRDRFRNAFPTLYQAAGYKPRSASKKKIDGPVRAADDQLSMSTTGPVRSRRRANTSQGLLRGGTKSVPQSTACSEDEESSAGEEESETSQVIPKPPTPVFVDGNHDFRSPKQRSPTTANVPAASAPQIPSTAAVDDYIDPDDEMELVTIDTDPLNIPDFLPNNTHSDMETWSSGLNTPTHSSTAAWSTAAASPTSSHVSDYFLNANGNGTSNSASSVSSPFIQRRNDINGNNLGMIGKSAWGTQDWFSPNPRLENSTSSNSSSSLIDSSFSPASPFSFHPHHGVLDRYDLFPPYIPDGNSSEIGNGDTHTTFSDEFGAGVSGSNGTSAGGTGFKGYHSQIAGDLISGGARMHQTPFSSIHLSLTSSIYGSSFGNGFSSPSGEISGLGLEGIPEHEGIHPMQLHDHDANMLAIDELGLTGISLNDRVDPGSTSSPSVNVNVNVNMNRDAGDAMDEETEENNDMLAMAFGISHSPTKSQHLQQLQQQQVNTGQKEDEVRHQDPSLNPDSFGLDDLVDMNELHATPPATPLLTQPRPMRRSSGGPSMLSFDSPMGNSGHHARSISVPPSEARNGMIPNNGMAMSMDDVGLHMHSHTTDLQAELRTLHSFFNPHLSSPPPPPPPPPPISASNSNNSSNGHRHRISEPMRLSNSTGSLPMSPILRHQTSQHNSQPQQQPTSLFPGNIMLSSTAPPVIEPTNSASTHDPLNHNHNPDQDINHHHLMNDHNLNNDLWRNVFPTGGVNDNLYNLSFLDLHYSYNYVPGQSNGGFSLDVTLDDHSEARQGQALDLAHSAFSASSSLGVSGNLGAVLRGSSRSPVGSLRQQRVLGRDKTPIPSSFTPPPPSSAPPSSSNDRDTDLSRSGAHDGSGHCFSDIGTIRPSQIKSEFSGGATVGRSMSHHRGQSAVCPQDLLLRNDNNKRKRASWDGGVA